MKARAPGKLVLSGAYAVLEGAPAIVAAVDRYVSVDTAEPAHFVTPEVRAALPNGPWPAFDASPLREGNRKLGLGSSAAILVASLAALELEKQPDLTPRALGQRVFEPALAAHRRAQGGGSGIDVAASCFGGVLLARRSGGRLDWQEVTWPAALTVHVLSEPQPASTQDFVASVQRLASERPAQHRARMQLQSDASERAARALQAGDAAALLDALAAQGEALLELGVAAGIPIFTEALSSLRPAAKRAGAALLPSGAGGGDLGLWVTLSRDTPAPALAPAPAPAPPPAPPPAPSLSPLSLQIGAPGVARVR